MKKIFLFLIIILSSSVHAEDVKEIDRFDGVKAVKDGDVIVLDYTSTVNRQYKLQKAAEEHERAQERERIIIQQNKIEKQMDEQMARLKAQRNRIEAAMFERKIRHGYSAPSSSSYTYSSRDEDPRYEKERLKGIIKSYRDDLPLGGKSSFHMNMINQAENSVRKKIDLLEKDPGQYFYNKQSTPSPVPVYVIP